MNNTMPVALPPELSAQQNNVFEAFSELIGDTPMASLAKPLTDNDKHSLQCWLKVLVCSDFVMRQCRQHIQLIAQQFARQPAKQGQAGLYDRSLKHNELSQMLAECIKPVENEPQLLQVLRDFRNQQMVRITYRDINGLADLPEVLNELTELANCSIRHALQWLDSAQQKEFGQALDVHGKAMPLIVIGMGKLGAYELNFSSDVDLIFAFEEHGETVNGPRSISHNEYFIKLGQRLIQALDKNTADGFVFRVDMRLRPFGQSGPLVMTFNALENYYIAHGREWERYALIKARVITGNHDDQQTLHSILSPFVYRRYIDFGVFEALREMKSMIAREVKQKKKEHNIKLGAGGIREIEFLTQAFQLLRGGRDIRLQERQLKKVLTYLAEQSVLPESVVNELLHSYDFLRRTEHRIQQIDDKQSHNLPSSDFPQARIAYGMGYADWSTFITELQVVRACVHGHFEQLFQSPKLLPQTADAEISDDIQGIWLGNFSDNEFNEEHAVRVLSEMGYQDAVKIIHLLASFKNSQHYRNISNEGDKRLDMLMPLILKAVAQTADSVTALQRIIQVLESICRRSVYLVLLIENPQGLSQLVKLCAASSWITRLMSRFPALFDQLLDARVLYAPLTKAQLAQELEENLSTIARDDLEQRMELLRHFKQSQSLRVAAADVTGVIPVEKVSDYLTWIAEVIINKVVQLSWHDMVARYGRPQSTLAAQKRSSKEAQQDGQLISDTGFAVLGFGKLGGIELGYSSDLDMVFIYANAFKDGSTEGDQHKNGTSVDNLQFYSRLSLRIMHTLQTQMHSGILYEADMRLRPNGNSGLITSNLAAFRQYELQQAWTWEHQALVRARFIAGDKQLISEYGAIRKEVLAQCRDSDELKKEVRNMRAKMRLALARKRKGYFDIKQGFGGVADIEFIVQFMVLKHAHEYPELLTWTDNMRILEMLAKMALLPEITVHELSECYRLLRARLHQLSLQEVSGIVSMDEFQQERKKIQYHWREIME
ncbi:MAG: bifunctional [glutamate--ammonia ligase]-adenylyl-L-tyrosine phosphorylase/[glutamate--ammonia-ligase] adenylyltransferase [gamma proteobacterium symbiont of Bathyaustriella thionipta]|nr:bifunctional [glutamate--ammonia ligase]-adenylyl-L-tyrosine phosphorylase/[glutamate--ammonia-ligase] adenylyltransferase [gamma proteobacterium symbiont of Bathyaustriella thionipta]MCU7948685.1 bifunctional [glutamate--ammonia ligase]-adenylyl-L-tyrosine phosphorylase/[glutamate--ammonia-ligase] adenylyltransferase [gamma proteobacterium symbiont of Bathyaustriella thionipta]MCU7952609.1 bifunctional [glutamate--ammonia ligase]-adenylyl-L-tyrosine phosphorylase/[glutamate--ammonia-ligase] a